MIRISSIGLSFISIVGNPCRATAGSFPVGPIEPAVEQRPSQGVEDLNDRLSSKHRLAMGYSTLSIYTHRSRAPSRNHHYKVVVTMEGWRASECAIGIGVR